MAKAKKLGFICYVNMPDRGAVNVDDLTASEREQWQANMCRRLSEDMSAYYTQHPEEFAAL